MPTLDLKSMSLDDLWGLHEQVTAQLNHRMLDEKNKLEERLRQLQAAGTVAGPSHKRRPYPKVLPKYRNPKNVSQTWAGRGKEPRWLKAQLRSGKKLHDFLIK